VTRVGRLGGVHREASDDVDPELLEGAIWGCRAPIVGHRVTLPTPGQTAIQYGLSMAPSPMQVPPNSDLTLGMVCIDKSVPGRTTWRMSAEERFANPAGIIQGGFIAAFADSSMGAAAVTYTEGRRVYCANAELKISFLGPVKVGSTLICEAEVVSGGKTVVFVEASVRDDEDRLVARATSTYIQRDRS
jgi:uncharacterized protein (TIGR00369 family)